MAYIELRRTKDGKKRYRAQIRINGHPPVSGTFEKRSDANRWAQETETEIRNGKYFKTYEARKHTFEELVSLYKKDKIPTLKSGKDRYSHIDYWTNKFGGILLSDITRSKIIQCIDELTSGLTRRKTIRSKSTVNRYLSTLSHIFSHAIYLEWLEDNPCRNIPGHKEPKGRTRFLDDDERKRLLNACKNHSEILYTIVVIAISTGARKGEILSLRWNHVDLNRCMITFYDTKNKEIRPAPLQGHALNLVKDLSKVRRLDTDLLFPSKKNPKKPINIDTVWKKTLKKSDINDFKFHDLRHTAASYLAMNGATLMELADILGHKTLQMVQRYAHLTTQHTTGVVSRMNNNIFSQ